jgi:hypothetical protein
MWNDARMTTRATLNVTLKWIGLFAIGVASVVPIACGGDDAPPIEPAPDASDVSVVPPPAPPPLPPPPSDAGDAGDASDGDLGDAGRTLDGALCGSSDFYIAKVDPRFGWTGSPTPITITGSGFAATPTVYLRGTGDAGAALVSVPKVGFVSATSITAEVPSGLSTGTYDLIVVNPNSCAHTLSQAFIVTSNAPPTVSDVSPGTGTTQSDVNVTVTGCGFAQGATLSTVSESGTVVQHVVGTITCADAGTCPSGTPSCTMTGTIQDKTKTLATGTYLVRVTNPDGSYGEYSLYAVTEPSGKLPANWVAAPALVTGRRSHAVTSARLDDASRFLYAVGGENAAGTALDTVEVAALDKYGTLGAWAVQKQKLPEGRAGHALVRQGKYLYVLGGTTASNGTGGVTPAGAPTATILRARLLDPADAPVLQDPVAGTVDAGGLAKGTWYYKVSAVLASGEETLPSNEGIAVVAQGGTVTLTWSAVAGASHYRVYRSAQADGTSQSEVLLKDNVVANDAGLLTYVDRGQDTPGTEKPEVRGATGAWTALGATLFRARSNTAALVEKDPSGQAYVYVLGGWGDCAGGTAYALMGCGEFATIDATGATLGSFAALAQTFTPRMRHGVSSMNALNGPPSFGDAGGANAAYLFVGGGRGPTAGVSSTSVEHALVLNGGQVGAWTVPGKSFSNLRDGDQFWVAVGYVFAFQGGDPAQTYDHTSESAVSVTVNATSITLDNWSNAGANLGGANKRGRHGVALESAHFYIIGGTSNDTDALSTCFQIVY